MKRSPLKRKSPMARKPMRRRRGSTKHSRRDRDFPRMTWIREQPCCVGLIRASWPRRLDMTTDGAELWTGPGLWVGTIPDPCRREVQAHHAGEHAGFTRPPDDTCIPLCDHHHSSLEEHRGTFADWPRGAIQAWELEQVARYQMLYAQRSTLPGDDEIR